MLKVAIVGCGGIGLTHIQAYKKIKGVEIAACVDIDQKKAQEAALLCGAKAVFDISDIPREIKAVSVVTSPATHYRLVLPLLKSGFNVFCEKPLTMNTQEAEELVEVAEENQKVLMVGFKMRYEPIFQEAKKYVSQIGPLRALSTIKQQPYHPRAVGNWYPKVGAMYELSVHDFDLIHWLTDLTPKEVLSAELGYRFGWEKEDFFFLTVKYSDGVIGHLQGMYATESSFFYRDLIITLLGDKGYIRIERPDRIVIHTSEFVVKNIEHKNINAFVEELTHFRNVIIGKEKNTLTANYGLITTKLIEAANIAYRTKKAVSL